MRKHIVEGDYVTIRFHDHTGMDGYVVHVPEIGGCWVIEGQETGTIVYVKHFLYMSLIRRREA